MYLYALKAIESVRFLIDNAWTEFYPYFVNLLVNQRAKNLYMLIH